MLHHKVSRLSLPSLQDRRSKLSSELLSLRSQYSGLKHSLEVCGLSDFGTRIERFQVLYELISELSLELELTEVYQSVLSRSVR